MSHFDGPIAQPRDRWASIVAYALLAAATQLLWLTYAAITTDAAHSYHVSVGAIGVLSEIFPLVFVVLAIPAGRLLDRAFAPALTAGAALVAAGGLVRIAGPSYGSALFGAVLVALAQPVVLSAAGKLAGECLSEHHRPAGIALGTAGNFVGMVLALVLGPALGGNGDLGPLLIVEGLLAVIPAVWLALALRRAPARAAETPVLINDGAARALWRDPEIRVACGLVFVGFGIFVALATWLQTLLHPAGISDDTAGLLLTTMIIAGVIGCAALPATIARRRVERVYMLATVVVTSVAFAALATAPPLGVRAALLLTTGLLLLPALPITLVIAEQRAGSDAAGTAGALIWMAGNLGGLVISIVVQILVHHPAPAFLAMALVALAAAPLAHRVRTPLAAPVTVAATP